jgi:predicted DNA binding CopG/RHH family protein
MATKAELEQQLAEAQAKIDELAQQAAAKPVVVTARVPQALREDMKAMAMRNGENLQTFMVTAFQERLERLSNQ